LNGILNINKPPGITSFQTVAAVRRAAGACKAGHTGTLDPDAEGVLPICLGRATRISEYLMETSKTYRADIKLGVSTDTYDLSGQITATGDATGITRTAIVAALADFQGDIKQVPPMYSALKQNGRPLYRLAREGVSVARSARDITIYRLDIIAWEPPLLTLELDCSKGTYIRSLAHDLGETLGCGAVMANLTRRRCGSLDIADAHTLEEVAEAGQRQHLEDLLLPMDSILGHLPALNLNAAQSTAFGYGQLIPIAEITDLPDNLAATGIRVYNENKAFIGIGRPDSDDALMLKPQKVFVTSPPRPIGQIGEFEGLAPQE
jgi:tRNA pseudouridine55 synthase